MRGLFMSALLRLAPGSAGGRAALEGAGLGDDELIKDIDYLRRAAGSPRTVVAFPALLREMDMRQVLPRIRAPNTT